MRSRSRGRGPDLEESTLAATITASGVWDARPLGPPRSAEREAAVASSALVFGPHGLQGAAHQRPLVPGATL
eukprot:6828903-Pyramimonas_sp.AAC.1